MQKLQVIDSHTGGEPTRLIISGGPALGRGSLAQQRDVFAHDFDAMRAAVVNEPRGNDVLVGAMLCDSPIIDVSAGVIFFNNVGYLGMCGHGTIGLMVSLAHIGRLQAGTHRIDTPVGVVDTILHDANRVSVRNVESYRYAKRVAVDVPDIGLVHGDIAWGGNWFFIVDDHRQDLLFGNINALMHVSSAIKNALVANNIRAAHDGEIDHIELTGASPVVGIDARNFVLCPGMAYDRSPCGTGTSAKLACLLADGHIVEQQIWRQESIVGSVFEARMVRTGVGNSARLLPEITGSAYVTAESTLLIDPNDAFAFGLLPAAGH